jgi:hypothetical protein
MDIFFFQLLIIFVPGLIWERIDTSYGRARPKEQWEVVRRAFLFGLASYAILFCLCWLYSLQYGDVSWLRLPQFKKEEAFIDANGFRLVAYASIIAVISGIAGLYAANRKWISRCLQRAGATKRFGDEDVWDWMFNSAAAEAEYVNIRDFEKQLAYSGFVEAFSETEKQREIMLTDVEVYNFDGVLVYKSPRVYLARKAENIDIEFPYVVSLGQE